MNQYLVFTGRPNAGKSSINKEALGLKVPIGKRPGTTRRISKYPLSRDLVLVDMPGFGRVLKASREEEERIKNRIIDFLESNASRIALSVHVLDISSFCEVTWRLEKKGIRSLDVEMIQFLADTLSEFPLIVANKIDKAGNKLEDNLSELKHRIRASSSQNIEDHIFPVSAKTGEGLGALKSAIHNKLVNKGFNTPFRFLR